MSQVTTYSNLEELESVSYSPAFNTYAASRVMFDAISSMSTAAIHDLITGSVDIKSTSFNAHVSQMDLQSPNAMRFGFAETYKKNMNVFVTESIEELAKQKSVIVKTITEMKYMVENKNPVSEKVVQMLNADKKTFKKSVEVLMNEVQSQHSRVFTKEMVEIVSKASAEAGFKTVNVVIKNSVPVISAVDAIGRGIVSEIRTDNKTHVVDLVSETIGMADGSCNEAIERLTAALGKYGVKYSNTNRRWTGGACWLPNAKEAEQTTKQNVSKKEPDRARKLNTHSKIKN